MDFKELLTEAGGLWKYSGGKYLAQLTSGKISNCFCNCGVITVDPLRLGATVFGGGFADYCIEPALIQRFEEVQKDMEYDFNVIGPGMGGITLAYELGSALSTHYMGTGLVRSFFTEPVEVERNGKKEKDQKFRFDLPPGKILFVEDVITTGGSVEKTMRAVMRTLPSERRRDVVPFVLCLVDRRSDGQPSGEQLRPEDGNTETLYPSASTMESDVPMVTYSMRVISLLKLSPRTWDTLELAQKDCPNVAEALRPKSNWKKLVEGCGSSSRTF